MPLHWELLVTDGHVRAARLRLLAPWFILIGVLGLAVGWSILNAAPSSRQFYSTAENTILQRVTLVRQPVLNVFGRATPLAAAPSQVAQFVPEQELADLYKAVSDGVSTGSFSPDVKIKVLTAAEFWSWNWPNNQLIALERGDLRAYGAVVYSKGPLDQPALAKQQGFPRPVRWLAIFRKLPSGWDNVAIDRDGFIAAPMEKAVLPAQIPLVLRRLMDLPEATP